MSATNSQTITIKVDLSCCQACVQQTKKLLQSFKGVESMSIDVNSRTVIVSGHIDQPHRIVEEIKKNGKVVTFYSVQSDDHQHQLISSTSQTQPRPVADDNGKGRPHDVQQRKPHDRQVNEDSNFHGHIGPQGIGVEETKHIGRAVIENFGPQGIGWDETGHMRRAFRHDTGPQGIGRDETEHIRRAFIHDPLGNDNVHFQAGVSDQTRHFYTSEGEQSHGHGHHHHHHADIGTREWYFHDNRPTDPSWSFSNSYNFHDPHQLYHERAHIHFNSKPDFDSLHYNYMHYPEMWSHYQGQIPLQQYESDPVLSFLTQFFSDDNPYGCSIM